MTPPAAEAPLARAGGLSSEQRRYLILEQGVGSIVINLALNAGIAAVLFRRVPSVPLWGPESIAGDTLATAFLLPLFTSLLVTPLTRWQLRTGRLTTIAAAHSSGTLRRWIPDRTWRRGAALGLACLLVVGLPFVCALTALGFGPLALGPFIAFKAAFAAALGAGVSPLIAYAALLERPDATLRPASHGP